MENIGIGVFSGNENYILYKYNPDLPLQENINIIIKEYNQIYKDEPLDEEKQLDLKIRFRLNNNREDAGLNYITEETVKRDIINGNEVNLVPCICDTVEAMFTQFKQDHNKLLLELSSEKIFIDEIVQTKRQSALIDWIENEKLDADGKSGAINVFCLLMKNGYQRSFSDNFVKKIVSISQESSTSATFALKLIVFILNKREYSTTNKKIIMDNFKVPFVMQYLRMDQPLEVSYYQLLFNLINTMISFTKGSERSAILSELNNSANRQIFYKFLCEYGQINEVIARGAFILQTRLLTQTYIDHYINREDQRWSVLSTDSDFLRFPASDEQQEEEKRWISNLQKADSMFSIASSMSLSKLSPTSLVSKCLDYGRQYNKAYFDSLEKADYSCEEELYTISQNVVSLLTDLLCVGVRVHDHNYYLPVYFASPVIETREARESRQIEFFEELFVRSLMLLFKTKAQMRVKSIDSKADFKKLYQVLKGQLKIIIEQHPKSFDEWNMFAYTATYARVQEQLQEERDKRWKYLYKHNKCLQDLKEHIGAENEMLINEQRLQCLRNGAKFINKNKKGDDTYFILQLYGNNKIFMSECNKDGKLSTTCKPSYIDVQTIKHIVIGERSSLVKSNRNYLKYKDCIFSIEYEATGPEKRESIACLMEDDMTKIDAREKEVNKNKNNEPLILDTPRWIDGFDILLGKEIHNGEKNKAYKDELDLLNEISCAMQLIELQDVEIPVEPPPVPEFIPPELQCFD